MDLCNLGRGTAICREELEGQIDGILGRITVSERFLHWAITALEQEETRDESAQGRVRDGIERRLQTINRQLSHINTLILSPDTDWELVS